MSDVLLLVHPGSLCGSYHTSYGFDPARYERLLTEVVDWISAPETRVGVVGGELDDELEFGDPRLRIAAGSASAEVFGAATDEDLRRAARSLVKTMRLRPRDDILVSGAWADAGDGCVTCVASELAQVLNSGRVRVSAHSPAAYDLPVSFQVVANAERGSDGRLLRTDEATHQNASKSGLQVHLERLSRSAADDANAFSVLAQHHAPAGDPITPEERWVRCLRPFYSRSEAEKSCLALQRAFFQRSDALAAELGVAGFRVRIGASTRIALHCYTTRSPLGLSAHCELRLDSPLGPTLATASVGPGGPSWSLVAGEWSNPDITAALQAQAMDYAGRALVGEEFRASAAEEEDEDEGEQLAA